jgi:hypothetical protein
MSSSWNDTTKAGKYEKIMNNVLTATPAVSTEVLSYCFNDFP